MRVSTGYTPHHFQQEIHRRMKRFSVLVCHRRFGKTVLAINALLDSALRATRDDERYGYIAPYRNQAKQIAWDYLKYYVRDIPGTKVNESELFIELPNHARVRIFGADNAEAMRGLYFDGAVLDEVADMKPEVWGEIIRPTLTDKKGWCLFIGTPRGMNLFYELYTHAMETDTWYAGMWTIDDTMGYLDWLDEEEVKEARVDMSEAQVRQELYCDFTASVPNALITIDMVSAARKKTMTEKDYRLAPKVIGVDVARFGDDRSVFIRRQGLASFEPRIYRKIDNMTYAGLIAQDIQKFKPDAVFIDAGRGEGVIDRLRQLGYDNIIEVNFGARAIEDQRYANKRTEMWDKMREWLVSGGVIHNHTELSQSLVIPQYSFDTSNRMVLEKKEDMKERAGCSPDPGDALSLTFAAPVQKRHPTDSRFENKQNQYCETEYKPFTRAAERCKTAYSPF